MNELNNIKRIVDEAIENHERELSRKQTEESIKRNYDWLNRVLAGAIGFLFGVLFLISLSECTQLSTRLRALESKQSK